MSDAARKAIAVGGSAGSLPVITTLLRGLAADSRLTVAICMHTVSRDADDICAVLSRHCALPVTEAAEGAPLAPGQVYVAPGGYHLLVERSRHFALCAGERVNYAQPAIDLLFETIAEAYRERLVGVLLSGANRDGAVGLRRIHELGGMTLVQRPDTASAPEMPTAALALFTPDGQNTPEELEITVRDLSRLTV